MSLPHPPYTFDNLAAGSKKDLDQLMKGGGIPAIEDILGYEFRGWNVNAATRLIGTRKFKKGFFGEPGVGEAWGFNMPVEQNALHEPWIDKDEDDPERYAFFKVFPASSAKKAKYPESLVIDYQKSDEYFFLNPVGYTVDYLVYPDPNNHDLILGKSYMEAGFFRPFLGYFILERFRESAYGRRGHFLNSRELETVEAFAEVFFTPGNDTLSPQQVAWNVDAYLARIRSNRIQSLKLLLFVIEYVLPRRSWWPFRRRFSKLKPSARKQFIEGSLEKPENKGICRDLAKLRILFILGYYNDPAVHPQIGFQPVPQRDRYQQIKPGPIGRPKLTLSKMPTEPSPTLECDVCVVGSGASGAVVAYRAAAAGRKVILLEEGPHVDSSQITHDEWAMTSRLYKEGGLQSTVDFDMTILQGQCLGGTTVINNAICFRLDEIGSLENGAPKLLNDWAKMGAHIDWNELKASYDFIGEKLMIRPLLETQQPNLADIDGNNARVLLEGWKKHATQQATGLNHPKGLFRKNYERCLGCGYCNFGCPYERKLSMLETFIPWAMTLPQPAQVYTGCHATEILKTNGQATGARATLEDGRELTVRASEVVLACGAIGSSVLLLKSGIKRNVGRYFSFNAGTPVFGYFPDRQLRSWDGVQMAAYVDAGEYLFESIFNPPASFAIALPGWFDTHFDRMRHYNHFANIGVLIGTDRNAHVKQSSLLRNLLGPIDYEMTPRDLKRLRDGIAHLTQIYFAAGAQQVLPGAFAPIVFERTQHAGQPEEVSRILEKAIRKPEDLVLNSSHPQGGNAISDDPAEGVVNSRFQVHGYRNLYVCDASVFPTTIGINPQWTIVAMADYFARRTFTRV